MIIINRGFVSYSLCLEQMRSYTKKRSTLTQDQIWLVQHEAIYTLGQAASWLSTQNQDKNQELSPQSDEKEFLPKYWHNIPVFRADRGGQVSYHAPGQLIIYLLLDLKRLGLLVREYVYLIEQSVINMLNQLGIKGCRNPGHPGVYIRTFSMKNDVAQAGIQRYSKISSLGIKISRGCSYHGVCLNIAMDLKPFRWINPCGQKNLTTVDLLSLGINLPFSCVSKLLLQNLLKHFQLKIT